MRFRAGDTITLEMPYATFVYRVTHHIIVPANDLGVLKSGRRELLALQACHPRFFATHRYIVYAKPVKVIPALKYGLAYAPAEPRRRIAAAAEWANAPGNSRSASRPVMASMVRAISAKAWRVSP